MLIDSGAMVTLVHEEFIKDSSVHIHPTTKVISGVTGDSMKVVGEADVKIEIADEEYSYPCIVVRNMEHSMLLGYDLLCKRGYVLDFSGSDQINTETTPVVLRLNRCTNIPPLAGKILKLIPRDKIKSGQEVWVIPEELPEKGVRVEESVSSISTDGRVIVSIINENNHSVTLDRCTKLATLMTQDAYSVNFISTDLKSPNHPELIAAPTESKFNKLSGENRVEAILKEMDISSLNLQQKNIVRRLVSERATSFALEGEYLPYTALVQPAIPTGDANPIRKRPYRMPEYQKEHLDKILRKLMEEEIIKPSSSNWATPMLLIPKKQPNTFRLVCDYRDTLNKVILKDCYPLPLINDLLDNLRSSKIFSTIDLKQGYHQLKIKPEDTHKTAFVCCKGLYEYIRLPMGLQISTGVFQRLLENLFSDLIGKCMVVYIDDLVVYSETEEQHEVDLRMVMERLSTASLSMKPDKCYFFQHTITYLGHEISAQGVYPNKAKLKCIAEFPIPRVLRQLRSFLGLCSYYRRFIKDFAKIAKVLTDRTKGKRPWSWGEEEQQAFENLKTKLMNPPILSYPRFDCQFILFTDASDEALGAVLSQVQDGEEKVIAYGSKRLNSRECNYSTVEKEAYAVVTFLEEYRCYLLGRHFVVVTDHKPLQWLTSMKEPRGRLGRWSLKLSEFDYEVKYRPGRVNSNADALSRIPVMCVEETEQGEVISARRLKVAQQKDQWCQALLNFLRHGALPPNDEKLAKMVILEADRHHIRPDGLLTIIPDGRIPIATAPGAVPTVLVPNSMKEEIMNLFHDHLTAGHLGFLKCLRRVQERYYWKGMYSDMEKYIKGCRSCAMMKTPPIIRRAMMGRYTRVVRPFQKIVMDIVGTIHPSSYMGNSCILVITDEFTKYGDAIPLPNMTAPTVAKALVTQYFCKHGAVEELLTDRASNFCSSLMKEVAALYQMTMSHGAAFNPRTQGSCERFNRTLIQMLSNYCQEDPKHWDEWIPFVLFAYNTSLHSSTLYTPYELVYGRKPILPMEAMMSAPSKSYRTGADYKAELAYKLYITHQQARNNMDEAQRKHDIYYNLKANIRDFQVGDTVYITNKKRKKCYKSKKFKPRFIGPYLVVEKLGDITYRLKDEESGKLEIVNVSRMKLGYYQRVSQKPLNSTKKQNSHNVTKKQAVRSSERLKQLDAERHQEGEEVLYKIYGTDDEEEAIDDEDDEGNNSDTDTTDTEMTEDEETRVQPEASKVPKQDQQKYERKQSQKENVEIAEMSADNIETEQIYDETNELNMEGRPIHDVVSGQTSAANDLNTKDTASKTDTEKVVGEADKLDAEMRDSRKGSSLHGEADASPLLAPLERSADLPPLLPKEQRKSSQQGSRSFQVRPPLSPYEKVGEKPLSEQNKQKLQKRFDKDWPRILKACKKFNRKCELSMEGLTAMEQQYMQYLCDVEERKLNINSETWGSGCEAPRRSSRKKTGRLDATNVNTVIIYSRGMVNNGKYMLM